MVHTSLFFFKQKVILLSIFLVYVDNIIVVSSSNKTIAILSGKLCDEFVLKDLGALHYFLGIEVSASSGELLLT